MGSKQDVELGSAYDNVVEPEREFLLPSHLHSSEPSLPTTATPQYTLVHLVCAFVGGVALCIGARFLLDISAIAGPPPQGDVIVQAPPYVGSTEVHQFPPASPTNAFPDLFPTKCVSFKLNRPQLIFPTALVILVVLPPAQSPP
jgi:hypothetical protein